MNFFDATIISLFSSFARNSDIFDSGVRLLLKSNLVKGALFMMIFWWIWFRNDEKTADNRLYIISTLVSSIIVLVIVKTLGAIVPFRLRPVQNIELINFFPIELSNCNFHQHSSFPSDTAALFFALATGLLFVSRKIGAFAMGIAILFVAFPKIYLGMHYPTDVLAGALIGMSTVFLGIKLLVKANIAQRILSWERSTPSVFYAIFFLVSYQIADLFTESQDFVEAICKAANQLLH